MKKLLNFGLIAGVILSFSALAACSGSDSDNGGSAGGGGSAPVVNGKRLVKVTRTNGTYVDSTMYVYNSKGQVIMEKSGNTPTDYVYTDSMIARSTNLYGYYNSDYYLLKNGRVVRDSASTNGYNGPTPLSNTDYEYDDAGQLTTVRWINASQTSSYITKITWQNGNIVKIEGDHYTTIYTYTSHPNTLPMLFSYVRDGVLWSQGYFGRICKNLPSKEVSSDTTDSGETSTTTTTFDYTFENGVVTKVIASYSGSGSGGNAICHFTWE